MSKHHQAPKEKLFNIVKEAQKYYPKVKTYDEGSIGICPFLAEKVHRPSKANSCIVYSQR